MRPWSYGMIKWANIFAEHSGAPGIQWPTHKCVVNDAASTNVCAWDLPRVRNHCCCVWVVNARNNENITGAMLEKMFAHSVMPIQPRAHRTQSALYARSGGYIMLYIHQHTDAFNQIILLSISSYIPTRLTSSQFLLLTFSVSPCCYPSNHFPMFPTLVVGKLHCNQSISLDYFDMYHICTQRVYIRSYYAWYMRIHWHWLDKKKRRKKILRYTRNTHTHEIRRCETRTQGRPLPIHFGSVWHAESSTKFGIAREVNQCVISSIHSVCSAPLPHSFFS